MDIVDTGNENEIPIIVPTSANSSKKRQNLLGNTNEFESLYAIDETRFSSSGSFIRQEPVETLEILIDTNNKKIRRKFMHSDNADEDEGEEIIYKNNAYPTMTLSSGGGEEVTYEYTGVLNPAYVHTHVNHADIRPTTPIRFEEARDIKRRSDNNSSVNRNIRFAEASTPPSTKRGTNTRLKSPVLHYEIHDGEPVRWQVARDLITPNWDSLRDEADTMNREYRYANVIEPVIDDIQEQRYRPPPPPAPSQTRGYRESNRRESPISFIEADFTNAKVGNEVKPASTLYSQLPFGSMKRPFGLANGINNYSNGDEERKSIKKVLKDPDTDEILSVKSFIDYTNTVDVVPESNNNNRSSLLKRDMLDDKLSIRTVSATTITTTTTTQNLAKATSAKSNNTELNISVIDINPSKQNTTDDGIKTKSINKRLSNDSVDMTESFPSPPQFSDDPENVSSFKKRNSFVENDFNESTTSTKPFTSPSVDELSKNRELNEISFNNFQLKTSENFDVKKTETHPASPATSFKTKPTSKLVPKESVKSTKSTASSNASGALKHPDSLPMNQFLNEIKMFRTESLKRLPEKTDMRVEYNFKNNKTNTNSTSSSPSQTFPPPPTLPSTPQPQIPTPPVPPISLSNIQPSSPKLTPRLTLPESSYLPDNPNTVRSADWSEVMQTFDDNIAGYTPKSKSNSFTNLKSEMTEDEKIDAQLF